MLHSPAINSSRSFSPTRQSRSSLLTSIGARPSVGPNGERPPLPFVVRLSLLSLALVFAVLALTALNPSPWIADRSPFLRHPPNLALQTLTTPPVPGCPSLAATTLEPRENGAVVLLLRERDLPALLPTLRNFEAQFNAAFRYPYVFLTDPDAGALSDEFRGAVAGVLPEGAVAEFAVIPAEDWRIPRWMDILETRKGFAEQERNGVQYAGREGYHHMCRFYSGLFARQEVLAKYDWYWRLEPGVSFFCSLRYDPFRFLALHNKVYGFVISIVDNVQTIPTLFQAARHYAAAAGVTPGPGLWDFYTREDGHGKGRGTGEKYNLCHFWTNFEVGDLRFFRGAGYQAVFEALDKEGGFYRERWGDAPVRSLALGLLTDIDKIHYFEDIAYQHDDFVHCPPKGSGLGCECKCPKPDARHVDIDNDWRYSCLPRWRAVTERGNV